MSTTVKSANNPENSSIEVGRLIRNYDQVRMFLRITDRGHSALINVTRDELVAAVATECHQRLVPDDAIVIEQDELHPVRTYVDGNVTVDGTYRTINKEFKDYTAGDARETGLRLLALAEYLDAHPPVDEAQVQAMTAAIWGMPISTDASVLARHLVEAGARIEVKP